MDGRQDEPILCGKASSEKSLLDDCIPIIQEFMNSDPTSLEFSISVLAPTAE